MKRLIFLMGFCFFALLSLTAAQAQNCQTAAKQTYATCQLTPFCPLACCNPSSCCKVAEKSTSCKPVQNTAAEVAPTKAQSQVTRNALLGTLGTFSLRNCKPAPSCKTITDKLENVELVEVKTESKSTLAIK